MADNDVGGIPVGELSALSPDVWFKCITRANNTWVSRNIPLDELRTAVLPEGGWSAYDIAADHGFIGTPEEWLESLKGQSAYDIAVESGQFTGSQEDWIAALDALYSITPADEGKVLTVVNGLPVWEFPSGGGSAHDHDNKTVLDKFSEVGGQLLYNDQPIEAGSGAPVWSSLEW